MGNSVTTIGSGAFFYCSSLTNIIIPDSVTTIGSYAFSSCSSLTNIIIPDSVTTIGSYAFSYCYNLKSVIIGECVTTIESNAFHHCPNLSCIYFKGYYSPPHISSNAFSDVPVEFVTTPYSYKSTAFGTLKVSIGSVLRECIQQFPFIQTNTFTNSNTFGLSNTFNMLNSLSESYSYSITLTYSLFITQTLTIDTFLSNSLLITFIDSSYTFTSSEFIYYKYTIQQFITYYSFYSDLYIIINQNETQATQKISNNELIGIICGSIAAVLLIIGIIIFVIQKGKKQISNNHSKISNNSSSDKQIEEVNQEFNNFIVGEDDQWL